MNRKAIELIDRLYLEFFRHKNRSYNINGHTYYPVEVQILEHLSKDPSAGVSQLSREFHVTRGAVSQRIKRLLEKGYLEVKELSGTRIFYRITQRGNELIIHHSQQLMDFYSQIDEVLTKAGLDEILGFQSVMHRLINRMEEQREASENT